MDDEKSNPILTVGLESLADAVLWFASSDDGGGPDIHHVLNHDGHSGPGWYASSADYPDEGSVFITANPEVLGYLVGHFAGREALLREQLATLKRALGDERVNELLNPRRAVIAVAEPTP